MNLTEAEEAIASDYAHNEASDELPEAAWLLLQEVERLRAEVTELGNKYVREVQRVEHCETCEHQGNGLCRGAGR